jgi:hypothetical protein
MKSSIKKSTPGNLIIPWALFLGVIVAFGACCHQGWKWSKTHVYTRFSRFHQVLCPETQYYPPASQVQILAQKRTKKELINVVIGGSSLSNGARQFPDEVWSDKLGELLGPEYRVLNLAFRAGGTSEGGAIIAETLLKKRRIVFVADMTPAGSALEPDGARHRYFFWDAWYKGMVDKRVPRRAAWLAKLADERSDDLPFKELRTGAWLGSLLFFNDFWNTAAYTHGGTVWNPVMQGDSFRPRRLLPDNETGPLPMEARLAAMDYYLPPVKFAERVFNEVFRQLPDGRWEADPGWLSLYRERMENGLPNEALRQRTLVLVHRGNPYCLDRLSAQEQAAWDARVTATQQVTGDLGMRSIVIGTEFTAEDYADHFHLTGSGGAKMAALAAPVIRELAKELGYETTPEILKK